MPDQQPEYKIQHYTDSATLDYEDKPLRDIQVNLSQNLPSIGNVDGTQKSSILQLECSMCVQSRAALLDHPL